MLKKIGILLLILVITAAISATLYVNSLKPVYKGNLSIAGIENTIDIYYDDYGIPHIYAENDIDAMTALGYVHAQDRLWQMELVSRIAAGRLSEIFGEKLIETDKFYLSLGITKASKETIANLDTNSAAYKQTIAYLNGVNEFVKNGSTPLEFTILGLKKDTFSIEDIYNVFGYMSYGFAMANQTDPLLSAIKEKLGDEYIQNLDLVIDPNTTLIKTKYPDIPEDEVIALTEMLNDIHKNTPSPPFIGSNSWVLSPKKTKNAQVIFANDPHIEYSQPAVWYQAHINTPTTEIYGFYLAMTPFPLLGHNRNVAYGLTMFQNDDIDLYVEKNNPDNADEYLYGNTYLTYKTHEESIPVKNADTIKFITKESVHGPIINEVVRQVKTDKPVAMYWVYTQRPNKLLEASYLMSRATNIDEFKKGPEVVHAPGLNIMYGDAAGNVSWWASANLFKRENDAPTKLLLNGSDPENDNITYLPFSENPQAINPDWNYVYSCNNQPDSIVSKRYIPGYYLPQNRAQRVVYLLEDKNDWTLTDTEKMVMDNTSLVALELKNIVVNNIREMALDKTEKIALEALYNWDGAASLKSIGTSIYTQFTYNYLKNVLEDELDENIYESLSNTPFMGRMLEPLLKDKYSIWIDNINTNDIVETNTAIQYAAFKEAVKILKEQLSDDVDTWIWERVHTVEHKHPLGEIAALRPYFNVGPFPIEGTNEVLNNQIFNLTSDANYKVHAGPSTRRIIDFSDVENAKAIIPTGQSGNIFSPHYKDQAQLFLAGKFIPMLLNKEVIEKAKNKLVLEPN